MRKDSILLIALILLVAIPTILHAQDSMRVNILGRYFESPWGHTGEVKSLGDYLYIATRPQIMIPDGGPALIVMSIASPTDPSEVIRLQLQGKPYGIDVDGDHVYVTAEEFGLYTIDVRIPSSPAIAGAVELDGEITRIDKDGDYAYIAVYDHGLYVVDVSDPERPFLETIFNLPTCEDVAVQGEFAYLALRRSGFAIVDISDPTQPFRRGTLLIPDTENPENVYHSIDNVALEKDYAYVTSNSGSFILSVDITDPDTPQEVSREHTFFHPHYITLHEDYALIPNILGRYNPMGVVDVSNPLELDSITTYEHVHIRASSTTFWGIETVDEFAYCSDFKNYDVFGHNTRECGLTTINIADPTQPEFVDYYCPGKSFYNIYARDGYAYPMIDGFKVAAIDVNDPMHMYGTDVFYAEDNIYGYGYFDNHIYLGHQEEQLNILEISDPEELIQVSILDLDGIALDISVNEEVLVLCMDMTPTIRIYSTLDPENPQQISEINLRNAICIDHEQDLLAVGVIGGIYLVDISNAEDPVEVEFIEMDDNPGKLDLRDEELVVSTAAEVILFDVTDLNDAHEASSIEVNQTINAVLLIEDHLAYCTSEFGVYIYNVSNPENPFRTGMYRTEGDANDIFIEEGIAFVANLGNGMQMLDCRSALGFPPPPRLTIPLTANYFNLVSSPIHLTNRNPLTLFGSLESLRLVMANSGGLFIPPDLNTIGEINLTQAYRIFCMERERWIIQGEQISRETLYTVFGNRMNWLGHPYLNSVPVMDAMQQIEDDIIVMYNDTGEMWVPGYFRSLENMVPGEGYYIAVSENHTFSFPDIEEDFVRDNEVELDNEKVSDQQQNIPVVAQGVLPTGIPYGVLLDIPMAAREQLARIELHDGDILVGATENIPTDGLIGLVAWQEDSTHGIPGFKVGNSIDIKALRSDGTALSFELDAALEGKRNLRYGEGGFAYVKLIFSESNNTSPTKFTVHNVYPNPFNSRATVVIDIPVNGVIEFELVNILGQVVIAEKKYLNAGSNRHLMLDGDGLPSGVYMLRICSPSGYKYTGKVALIK
ncbi:T9SS type A sorting domain-containing protein [bacterium]|nr:T9SS type A sorting domain-containing protein [bacterium]